MLLESNFSFGFWAPRNSLPGGGTLWWSRDYQTQYRCSTGHRWPNTSHMTSITYTIKKLQWESTLNESHRVVSKTQAKVRSIQHVYILKHENNQNTICRSSLLLQKADHFWHFEFPFPPPYIYLPFKYHCIKTANYRKTTRWLCVVTLKPRGHFLMN